MKPLPQRRQHAGEDQGSPSPSPKARESVVVVLGVMYPGVLPQPADASTSPDLALPPSLDGGRQSVQIIFYDPLSSERNGDDALVPKYREKYKCAGCAKRAEIQKAVALDLAMLSSRRRR